MNSPCHLSTKQFLVHLNVLNRDIAVVEVLFIHDTTMKRNQVLDTGDHGLVKRRLHSANRIFTVSTPYQQLGEERIKTAWHFVTRVGMRVAADAKAAREVAFPQATGAGNKFTGVLCVQATLDGVASPRNILLGERKRFTLGDPYAEFNEVVSRDEFGDGVFNLYPRVDFEEVEIPVRIAAN